ncbi:hypothetical protein TanjilG_14895 [Lupinus angustifolius]|uniref:Vacuolar iron transporter n=1 Tax=Lupinus angustifolius TaxID=3871 RepID=A0A1J7H729_LUPAN|nr:PREDICTED: vacuolar iron transporter homolog 2-like [Lupinus angustifolius]OIV96218.1 hypothetical protein TanjilG_14895 [Lupinus angustifolius]
MAAVEPCSLVPNQHDQKQTQQDNSNNNVIDYSQRAQWLRAAVMGANDGLVSIASLMMGVGAVRRDVKPMLLAGFAGSVAGASSMAIGEFVSVYTQYEVEVAQRKRDMNEKDVEFGGLENKRALPNPLQAAFASAFSFVVGAIVPLLAAAFIIDYKIRLMVVVFVASLALVVFGWVGALLGKTPKIRSCARVLVGGWMAMVITFGLTKLLGFCGLEL